MKRPFVFGVALSALTACTSPPGRVETPTAYGYGDRLARIEAAVDALAKQQQRSDCLVRQNVAVTGCVAGYAGEPAGSALQSKIVACVRSKAASCEP